MNKKSPIFIGSNKVSLKKNEIEGSIVKIKNESYYKITNVKAMRPFFINVVSSSNHWMFLSSNGGLTAGRKNSNSALFPYYTDDKITEFAEFTGSKTILKVYRDKKNYLWEPFSDRCNGMYKIQRNLYKNNYGNKVIFEEINEDLQLTFSYHWNFSETYGFIKKSTLKNLSDKPLQVELLDGIQNILPYGVEEALQLATSNLVDAYKRNELIPEQGIGIFALSAVIVDKAEPSEALKATTVWSSGIKNPTYLLSSLQLNNFRKGNNIQQETDIKAEKGAYFIHKKLTLKENETKKWILVAEVNQSVSDINEIRELIRKEPQLLQKVEKDIDLGTQKLVELTASSDGFQLTADELSNTRHFSNTLFNIMRGGIFSDNYNIEKQDFTKYITKANKNVASEKQGLLKNLSKVFTLEELKATAKKGNCKDFERLCLEYLPLMFSRRHGDPSRPWNKFSINTKSEADGSKILDYEGNWRDIFQNWEALAHSYPEFIDGMIHKFLNASTFDGYNPYRVTKGGFDWEIIEPEDPWSYIGYWGDHQIIYLLKFLEFIEKYYPNKLASYFDKNRFVYANVPYKIKTYADILKNPKDTIVFDVKADKEIRKNREKLGADGALLTVKNKIYKVNLIEKLLATTLAKVSNFIPEAGIWMNTQRPEWNDANNALVGNGVSMVTLYYLRRFLCFFKTIIKDDSIQKNEISEELFVFFSKTVAVFEQHQLILSGAISNTQRKAVTDALGKSASDFRTSIYSKGFSGKKTAISKEELLHFIQITLQYVEHTIRANKRNDDLYHSYNLMTLKNENEIAVSYLPEMLEGQVAILSSGYISAKESLKLLNALKNSKLFREDQYSYILYPNKELSGFMEKNNIPKNRANSSALMQELVKDGNKTLVEKDVLGEYHFNGSFNNANNLKEALKNLPKKYKQLVAKEKDLILTIFEEIFDHKSFTGRSGTFFGYEGLGSIYWHMVSKLLLSVQETCLQAIEKGESKQTIGKLLEHYYEINEGLGVHKSPELYGAFPTDAYSHTPAGKGAQQPGMTGQVKEDILSRFGELGVFVKTGKLFFNPCLLRKEEFLKKPSNFKYIAVDKAEYTIKLQKNTLSFTYCQVPIIFQLSDEQKIEVTYKKGTNQIFSELCLDVKTSSKIFKRTNEIEMIKVYVKK